MPRWKRTFYFILGWVFVALGVIGLLLPIIPTTPFLLVASSCFLRSSPRFRNWLLNNRWFGPMLREWDEHKAVRTSVKVAAVAVIAVVIALTFVRPLHWGVRATVIGLALVGLMVVWKLPVISTITVDDNSPNEPTAPSPTGEQGRRDIPSGP